jgi:UDP-N-acetylmuramoylalanine--D-glutamate ligase
VLPPGDEDGAGRVVWLAGGQAKGTTFDELVIAHRRKLRGAVLLGADREVVGDAIRRHAPDVPVIRIDSTDTGAMAEAVQAAAFLAHAGDVVLLAPGCASFDMFTDYAARGNAFAAAVRDLVSGRGAGGTFGEPKE